MSLNQPLRQAGIKVSFDDGVWAIRLPGDTMTYRGFTLEAAVSDAERTCIARLTRLKSVEGARP